MLQPKKVRIMTEEEEQEEMRRMTEEEKKQINALIEVRFTIKIHLQSCTTC